MTTETLDGPQFDALMERMGGFERRPRVAVGVSGGADSVALALLLHDWAAGRGGEIVALTVDHGLRSESAGEAAQVAERLTARGIRHAVLRWTGPKPASGIQDAARTARLRLLSEFCRNESILHLALAHHRDDQAETVLMRLARGSGIDGLSGMAAVRAEGLVRIIRPLLDQPRERLRAVCRERGIDWIEDPSNASPSFARGRLRAAAGILAAEGLRPERLLDTAHRAARARRALGEAASALLARAAEFHPEGWAVLSPSDLTKAPEEIGLRALSRVLETVGGHIYAPRDDATERLLAEIRSGAGRGRTLGGCVLLPKKEALVVAREPEAAAEIQPIRPGETIRWDGRFDIGLADDAGTDLFVGRLGEDGWRQAAALRKDLVRLGLPLPVRLALPGLWDGRRLVAVPRFGGNGVVRAVFAPPVPAGGPAFSVVWERDGII